MESLCCTAEINTKLLFVNQLYFNKIEDYLHALSLEVVSDSWDVMDCSPPDSSVHGILHARIVEWVAMPFSK